MMRAHTLSIADVSTADESAANLTATVTLSGDSSQTVTVVVTSAMEQRLRDLITLLVQEP